MSSFDVVIIGSGPGGYVATLVHNWVSKQQLSKIFNSWWNLLKCWLYSFKSIASSHHFSEIAHFADHGIELSGVSKSRENDCANKRLLIKLQVE
jgi:dihydrolipoamide dehydrogenase